MPIEKAFAIDAGAPEIYAAIERDLNAADEHAGDTFEVIRRDPPRSIDLRVTIGGKSLASGNIELKPRTEPDPKKAELIPIDSALRVITDRIRAALASPHN